MTLTVTSPQRGNSTMESPQPDTSEQRVDRIRERLETAFAPAEVTVNDDSHKHVGHAGAQSGMGHYTVWIRSDHFRGVDPLTRHRMVYDALGEMMHTDIHALAIRARSPEE